MTINVFTRQGYVLSPLLFNLYSETVFREALEVTNTGTRINGKTISNLRYADDTVVIASSLPEIHSMMGLIVERSERYGLFINVDNEAHGFLEEADTVLHINNKPVEQVRTFRYLSAIVNDQSDPTREIKARIEQARSMKNLFTCRDLSLRLRLRLRAATSSQSYSMDAKAGLSIHQ